MFKVFFDFLLKITQGLGYGGVGILMAIESSFVPMPSEIIIPPAAYLASQGEMNIFLIVLFGVLGSLVGAIFNYYFAYYLGRPLIYKLAGHSWAKFLLIDQAKVAKAEKYFLKNSSSATFIGRLIPVIRQLISLPAGFSKMPLGKFIIHTTLGAFIWVSILAALGYFIGANQALLHLYYQEIKYGLLALGGLWVSWFIYQAIKKKNSV